MKRLIAFAIAVIMLVSVLSLAACGGGSGKSSENLADSKYVGTWKATTMALKDESEALGSEWTLILKEDGTGQSIDEEGEHEITWELTKNGFKMTGDGNVTFTDEGDNIKTKVLGVSIILERQ